MHKANAKSLRVVMSYVCAWAKYDELVIAIREPIVNGISVRAVAIYSRYMLSCRKIKMIVVKTMLYVCRKT